MTEFWQKLWNYIFPLPLIPYYLPDDLSKAKFIHVNEKCLSFRFIRKRLFDFSNATDVYFEYPWVAKGTVVKFKNIRNLKIELNLMHPDSEFPSFDLENVNCLKTLEYGLKCKFCKYEYLEPFVRHFQTLDKLDLYLNCHLLGETKNLLRNNLWFARDFKVVSFYDFEYIKKNRKAAITLLIILCRLYRIPKDVVKIIARFVLTQ